MFDKYFSICLAFVRRHDRAVLGLVALVTALAGAGLVNIRYEGRIDLMLPPDRDVTRSMDFLRDANLSDKTVISLSLTDPTRDPQDLLAATDTLAASLTPPLFKSVVSGVSLSDVMAEFSVLQYAPQLLGERDLATIDAGLSEQAVSHKLRGIYLRSLRPDSMFSLSQARTDPLGISALLFEKLRALPASMGYDVTVEGGHFLSRDRRHALLIVQTSVPMMDSEGSKVLLATLQERLGRLPPFVAGDVIGAHVHTVSNERVVKRDIMVASTIASLAFVLLLLLVFRDLRALFVFVVPLVAVAWAINICTAVEGRLSYLVIGLGTAIAGISIDYGLLVYIAMRRGADDSQMVKLAKLVFIDAVTTMFSFAVLYVSVIRGYHQLALLSVLCVLICLLVSLLALPLTLSSQRQSRVSDATIGDRLRSQRWPARLSVGLWALSTLALLVLSFGVRFESDVKRLDGSEPEVLQAEERFHAVWGGKANQALLVVHGQSLEQAMQMNDGVFREATQAVGEANFTSLALFWPSRKLRTENGERWDRFWRAGRERELRQRIAAAAPTYGFSDRAFDPFFQGLYTGRVDNPNPSGLIARLQERFVVNRGGECRIMSFFPDEPRYVEPLRAIAAKYPGAFIVSGSALSASISALTARELRVLAPLAVLFNVVLTWLFFRNVRETAIALVPVVTGVVWLMGLMSLFGVPLNVVSVVAAIVSTGVIVDYGLGITYEYRYDLRVGTVVAVTLSAATNVIGTGALLFARHPALYSTGLAMVICMLAGYLSAVIVIPSLCSLLERRS
jgi:predicted RND superfamily exporter protein